MNAKEYLSQLLNINKRIKSLELTIQKYYCKAENCTSNTSGVPPSSHSNYSKVESNVINVIESRQELQSLIDKRTELILSITKQINLIDNNLYVALLQNRYVNCCTWEETAELINKDVDYTKKKLHIRALKEFEKIFV